MFHLVYFVEWTSVHFSKCYYVLQIENFTFFAANEVTQLGRKRFFSDDKGKHFFCWTKMGSWLPLSFFVVVDLLKTRKKPTFSSSNRTNICDDGLYSLYSIFSGKLPQHFFFQNTIFNAYYHYCSSSGWNYFCIESLPCHSVGSWMELWEVGRIKTDLSFTQ